MIQRDVGFDSTAEELSFECEQEGIYFICESPIPIEEMDITKSFDVTLKTSHQLEATETVNIVGIPAQEINRIKLDRTKILEFEIPLISYGSMEIKVGDKTKTINYSSYLSSETTASEIEAGNRLGLIKTETGWTQDYKIFSDHALYNNNEIIFSADVDAPQNIDVSLEFPADSTVQLGTFYKWDNGIWIESDYILYADSLTYFKQEFDWFERNKPQVKFNISVIGDNGYVGFMDPLISACGALSTVDAVYTLTSSVSSAGTCFTIGADNITLDCDGYNITYAQTLEGYAFYNTGGYDSVKIKNCNIDQPGTGPANSHAIYYWTGDNGEILNNNIDVRQSNCDGIYIRSSDSNLISENNIITRWGDGINVFSSLWTDIENNVINTLDADTIYILSSARSNVLNNTIISRGFGDAIYLGSSNINTIINNNVSVTGVLNVAIYVESSTSNIIYNNLFNSSTPFTFGGSILINNWNTTKQAGTRIYSDGTQIGGNYWTNPTSTGYSDTCIDSDVDDFCDIGYDLTGDGKNIDYLPLTATDVQYISACAVLDQKGTTYILTSDIINSGANLCINISANDVTLDCQGYMIDGNVLTGDVGIGVLRTSSTDTNVIIKNCVVADWLDYGIYLSYANQTIIRNTTVKSNWRGIYLMDQSSRNDLINITASSNSVAFYIGSDTSYNNLVNITADSNSWGVFFDESIFNNITNSVFDSNAQYGVRLYDSHDNMMMDSRISNSGTSGVYIDLDASGNKFYNNLFNNTNNVEFSGTIYTNYWNTTKQSGTRIYSDGTQIGGNYWTNPTKTGYSDTCLDSDEDDFCDVGYDLSGDGKNIDYLPLIEENNIIPPQISFIPPTELNNSHIITSYTTINVSVSDSGSPNNITAFIDWNRSLVGWWRFNQESGESTTFFRDWSSYGNDGICLIGDCPIYTTGKFGSALYFDGVDDYVEVAHSESLNLTSEITIEVWVNPDAPGQTNWSRFVSKRTTAGGEDVYALGLTEDTYRPFFRITNSSIQTILTATGLAPKNQWTHLVATYNGSKMKIYINGVENASKDKIGAIKTSTIDLHLGDRKDEAGGRRLNGTIDEVRIYNRSLSAEEIKASYNTGLYRLETNYTDLAGGTYTYTAYAQDLLGNVNSTETRTLTIGTQELSITIQSPENITYNTQPIWFNVSLNSAGGSCWYDLNNSLSFPLWMYKKNIVVSNILNTDDLVDYQVLINLTSSNFDFSKANLDGNDTRFTWINSTSGAEENASFWVESWDSVGEKALIWVKVPFVALGSVGNLYMYYGNAGAGTESNQSEVCPGGSPDDYCYEFYDNFSDSTFTSYENDCKSDSMSTSTTKSGTYYSSPYGSYLYTGSSGFCGDAGLVKEFTLPGGNLWMNFYVRGTGDFWSSTRGVSIEQDGYGYGPVACDVSNYNNMYWLACARRGGTAITTCGGTDPETGNPYIPTYFPNSWTHVEKDISRYAGETIRLRILVHDSSNTYCNYGDHSHWLYVDDISIRKYTLTEPNIIIGTEDGTYIMMANDTLTHFYASETLAEGQYSVIFRCKDSVGNVEISDVIVFSYVFNPFVITIESPLNATYGSKPWFNVSLSSQGLWCGYSLDGGAMLTMLNDSNTHFYIQSSVLVDKQYSIFFNCTDLSATMKTSSTEYFTVDTTGPSITIQSPLNDTYSSLPWFDVTLDEPGLSCSYSLDGALYVGMSNDSDIHFFELDASLLDGPHSIRFRCTDLASNTNTTDLVYFTVDTTGSQIIVNSPLNPIYTTQIVLFNVTATDSSGVDWCGYSLNGSANVTMPAGPSDTFYFLNDTLYKGSYEVVFYCNDSNGIMNNTDPILFDVLYDCMFDSECAVDNICVLNTCTPFICTDYCTNNTDLVCHSACDGRNGCDFYDAAAIAACDGQQYGQWVDYGGNKVIKCCEGAPYTSYDPDVVYAGLNPLTVELGYVADVAVSVRNRNDFEDTFTITLESTSNLRYWSWFSTHRNDEMRNRMEISFAPFEQKFISLRVLGGTVGCFNGIDNLKVKATTSFGKSDVESIDVCVSPAASGSVFSRSVPGISDIAIVVLVLLSAFLYGGRNRIYKHKSKR